jgi:hypothetical protein
LALATEALRGFAKTAERTQVLRQARELLADLLVQDIDEEPKDGGGPAIRHGTTRDRIVSTTDPEMRHGHKSHAKGFDGYKASIVAETTCGVILATDVRAANVHDAQGACELVTEAAKRAGHAIGRMLGDTAYGDTATRAAMEAVGVDVIAKTPPGTRQGMFSQRDFQIDKAQGVARCPAGQRSRRRVRIGGEDPGWRYVFTRHDCGPCSLRGQCTKAVRAARVVQVTAKTERLQRLRARQATQSFRRQYRQRVVVEHRIARLVQLGVRQARYFGRRKVGFQVLLAAAVANLRLLLPYIITDVGGPMSLLLMLTGCTTILFAACTANPSLQRARTSSWTLAFAAMQSRPSRPGL